MEYGWRLGPCAAPTGLAAHDSTPDEHNTTRVCRPRAHRATASNDCPRSARHQQAVVTLAAHSRACCASQNAELARVLATGRATWASVCIATRDPRRPHRQCTHTLLEPRAGHRAAVRPATPSAATCARDAMHLSPLCSPPPWRCCEGAERESYWSAAQDDAGGGGPPPQSHHAGGNKPRIASDQLPSAPQCRTYTTRDTRRARAWGLPLPLASAGSANLRRLRHVARHTRTPTWCWLARSVTTRAAAGGPRAHSAQCAGLGGGGCGSPARTR